MKFNCCCGQGRICPTHGDTTPKERVNELQPPPSYEISEIDVAAFKAVRNVTAESPYKIVTIETTNEDVVPIHIAKTIKLELNKFKEAYADCACERMEAITKFEKLKIVNDKLLKAATAALDAGVCFHQTDPESGNEFNFPESLAGQELLNAINAASSFVEKNRLI